MGTKRTRPRFREDDRGLSALIGLTIGVALFSVGFYYVIQSAVEKDADTNSADRANLEGTADSMAQLLFEPGMGWYNGAACVTTAGQKTLNPAAFSPDGSTTADTDGLQRFGLGEEACLRSATDPGARNNVSYTKMVNLFHAGFRADPDNGYADYEEAASTIGLEDQDLGFHLRSWPLLASVRDVLTNGQKDPNMRAAYIGDYWDASSTVKKVAHSVTTVDASDTLTVRIAITNNGTTATIFGAVFEIPLEREIDFTLHTPLLAPGQSNTIEVTLRKSADWDWDEDSNKKIFYEIHDTNDQVGGGEINLSAVNMLYSLTQTNVFVEADKSYWILGSDPNVPVKVNYMAFEGDGDRKKFSDWTLWIVDPLGVPQPAVVLPNNSDGGSSTISAGMEGAYEAELKNDLLTVDWNLDLLNVVDAAVGSFTVGATTTYWPGAAAPTEVMYLDLLAGPFDGNAFSLTYDHPSLPYAAGGDVFPDLKNVMNNDLVDALTDENGDVTYDYTVLIVGSNVDHNVMTSAAAKNTIRDWVLGGGTMIVYGSDDQSVQWLQPLFHSSLTTASGGLQTPDEDHPVLHTPNDLDYAAFQYNTQWSYNSGADEAFTHVVTVQSGGDLMAVSDAGAFGQGRVLLSGWRPYALTLNQDEECDTFDAETQCDALFLVHNMLTLSYRYLYLDYGPAIPDDADAGTRLRVLNVYHPELREVVALQVQVYVFKY